MEVNQMVASISDSRRIMPLLPLRGLLVFPAMVLHLDVGREKSIKALEQAMLEDSKILLATQLETNLDEPSPEDIYEFGTIAEVKQMMKLPNGTIRVLVEGLYRAKLLQYTVEETYYAVEIEQIAESNDQVQDPEIEALMRSVLHQFEHYIKLSKKVTQETFASVQ